MNFFFCFFTQENSDIENYITQHYLFGIVYVDSITVQSSNFFFIHQAHDLEDKVYPAYKLTKSYLNSDHLSLIFLDTLPRKSEFFGKKQKRNAI